NFKPFGDPGADLELAPMTFFVGPNGSGKSSVLDLLTVCTQTVQTQHGNGLLWKGDWVDLNPENAVHRGNKGLRIRFRLDFDGNQKFDEWQKKNNIHPKVEPANKTFGYEVSTVLGLGEWTQKF